MKLSNKILFTLAALILVSCASAKEKQAELVKKVRDESAPVMACRSAVYGNPVYSSINQAYPQDNVMQASAEQQMNKNKPSPAEIQLLVKMHNDLIPCRKSFIEKIQTLLPEMMEVYKQEWAANDEVTIKLIQQQLSWGEAVKQRQQIKGDINEKLQAISNNPDAKFDMPEPKIDILAAWPYPQ